MGALDTILTYITDKERRLSTKTYVTIISLALLIILDNVVGLSYHYSVDKKLNEIYLISQILEDTTLEKSTRKELIALRQEVLNKKYFYDNISDGLRSLYKKEDTPVITYKSNIDIPEPRNNFWFLMSSSGIELIFYFVLVIIFPFFDKSDSIGQKIAVEIILIVFGALKIGLNYWIFGFIPKIGDTWIINYILNFTIHLILFITILILIVRQTKKKTVTTASKFKSGLI